MKCEICNKEFKSLKSLGLHLSSSHNMKSSDSKKDYYDKYLRKPEDGICPVCSKPTKWKGGLHGYARTCSISCGQKHPETRLKMETTNLERFGATNPYGSEQIREKIKQTNLKRYGVENAYSIPEIHQKALANSIVNEDGNHSSWETLFENALLELGMIQGKDYEKHYNKDFRYPYECDFYLYSTDTFIEINGFWMHGFHFFDENNPKDITKLNAWKSKNSRIYKSAISIWTKSDIEKRDCAIKNNLNYVVLWSKEDINNYIKSLHESVQKSTY